MRCYVDDIRPHEAKDMDAQIMNGSIIIQNTKYKNGGGDTRNVLYESHQVQFWRYDNQRVELYCNVTWLGRTFLSNITTLNVHCKYVS